MDSQEVLDFIADVKSRLKINDADLVEECKRQPSFYLEVAEQLPKLKSIAKRAKGLLDFTRAELERTIRNNPKKFGVEKVTETVIVATVTVQPEYQEALEAFHYAEELADSVQHCVVAVEHRKSMIRDIVDLFGNQYRNSDMTMWSSSRQAGDARADEITRRRRSNAKEQDEQSNGQS